MPSKLLQARGSRTPPRGETRARGGPAGWLGRRGHAQRDPSVLGTQGSVQGRDTGAARLLIGHRRAERGGAGEARSEARGQAGVQRPLGEAREGIGARGRRGGRSWCP